MLCIYVKMMKRYKLIKTKNLKKNKNASMQYTYWGLHMFIVQLL